MSLHVTYDHQCDSCGADYVPYDQGVPCPRCGQVESERFDFVPWAAASLLANRRETGSYLPRGWAIMTLGDQILRLLFGLLDAHERVGPDADFRGFADGWLADIDWGERNYLRAHVQGIAERVHTVLEDVGAGKPLPALAPIPRPKRADEVPCPTCGAGLGKLQSECHRCDWLRYPSTARQNWGNVGCCPRCEFSYRWDGTNCSHCGWVATK